ncbi:MAG: hypothetical protein CL608_13900 [Anaerolineaceae bacterium]|nr:hypothetical protein [Anaerolineaceae bacterium]
MNYLLFAATIMAQTEPVGVPALVPIVIAVILLLLFWWGLSRNSIPQGAVEHAPEDHHDNHEDHHDVAVEMAAPASMPSEAAEMEAVRTTAVNLDDLKIIEGIGPKIEGILHDAGINTFAELAAASVSQLEKIVREDAGIRIAFPDTWPKQAQLAADGQWTELEQLQDELKGGRQA